MLALVLATVLAGTLAFAPGSARARSHVQLTTLEGGVLRQINNVRRSHGLVPLRVNPQLTAAADQHTAEMGSDGYFEHASVDGTAFWRRIVRWYDQTGYSYWSVGENLLWSSPDVAPASALRLWMASPEHRANILAARWREIGIAAVHVDSAPGTYDGRAVTIITTDFGVRH